MEGHEAEKMINKRRLGGTLWSSLRILEGKNNGQRKDQDEKAEGTPDAPRTPGDPLVDALPCPELGGSRGEGSVPD